MIRKSVTRRSVLKGTAALGVGALASRFPMPAIAQGTALPDEAVSRALLLVGAGAPQW